jgi:hypothetical protein
LPEQIINGDNVKTTVVFLLPLFFLLPLQESGSKAALFCRKWQQVVTKSFSRAYNPVSTEMAKVMEFRSDGSYQEQMFMLESKGQWKFNADSSKFVISLTELNGQPTKDMSLDDKIATDLIIRLTSDTLIVGEEGYFGPEKIYGHDDWYFVPINN